MSCLLRGVAYDPFTDLSLTDRLLWKLRCNDSERRLCPRRILNPILIWWGIRSLRGLSKPDVPVTDDGIDPFASQLPPNGFICQRGDYPDYATKGNPAMAKCA